MDASLRKRHKYIWRSLAVMLPILLITIIKDLDFNPIKGSGHAPGAILKPIKWEKHDLVDAAITEKAGARVLELKVKQPIKSASSIVFVWSKNGGRNQEIGQIGGVGTYAFPLESEIGGIIIKDIIKNQEILKVSF